jgi:hypothetical protein
MASKAGPAVRPWEAVEDEIWAGDERIGKFEHEDDAGHVEVCVNAHGDMLKALEAIVDYADASSGQLDRMAWDSARAAIAKAKGV